MRLYPARLESLKKQRLSVRRKPRQPRYEQLERRDLLTVINDFNGDGYSDLFVGVPGENESFNTDNGFASRTTVVNLSQPVPTPTVNWSGWTYDGMAHAATGAVAGIGEADLGLPTSFTYYAGIGTGGTNMGGSAPVNAGTYTVVAHYSGNTAHVAARSLPVTVTVSLAALTVTAANKTKTYGQTVTFDQTTPSSDFTVSGLVNSDFVTNVSLASSGAEATAAVGSYAITPSNATGSGLSNYTISYVNGTLTVNAATLTITAANKSKTYGQTVTFDQTTPSADFTVSGLLNSDTVNSITLTSSGAAATASVAGSPYSIVASAAVGTGLSNYTISYVNGTLTVNAATLTITAANKSKTYGQTVTFDQTTPSADFTVSGLLNSDTVNSITLTSSGAAATASVAGSPYSIVASAAVGTGLSNYTISYVNGSLTVNAATLTITAANKSKTYGQTVTFDTTTPSSDFSVASLLNSDTVTNVSLASDGAPANAAVGGYAITLSNATGSGLSNYTISYVYGTLTVNAAALTVTAANKTKTYGQTVTFDQTTPSSDFTVSGLVNSDFVTNVSLASSGAEATAAVGSYAITPSNATGSGLSNYPISYVNGTLTVNAATLTITAANKTKTYGQTVTFDVSTPSSDFSVSGLVNADTVTNVSLASDGAAATASVAGSPYSIVASAADGTGLANYTISYVNGSLTVNAAATFPWHNFAKPFDVNGGPNNAPDDHIVAGDALAVINYLNAFGAGPVPADAEFGLPFGFLDASGGSNGAGDNFVTAGDALDIINFLNAGLGGEGESAQSVQGDGDLLTLLALDLALHPKRRRS